MFEHNFSGRYSEILENVLDRLGAEKILKEEYEDDYQGYIDVDVLLKDGRVFSYEYSYGSCSGCDSWEAMDYSIEQIEAEMLTEATFFDNIDQYNKWKESTNIKKGEDNG